MTRPILTIGLLLLALVVAACGEQPPSPDTTGADETTPAGTGAPEETAAPTDGEPSAPGRGAVGAGPRARHAHLRRQRRPARLQLPRRGTGEYAGFDVDFCRAVAAAVLGDPTSRRVPRADADERGPALQTGEVDVLIRNTTWTVEPRHRMGPVRADHVLRRPGHHGPRRRSASTTLEDLDGATICVQTGTTTELNLADQMRRRGIDVTRRTSFGDDRRDLRGVRRGALRRGHQRPVAAASRADGARRPRRRT